MNRRGFFGRFAALAGAVLAPRFISAKPAPPTEWLEDELLPTIDHLRIPAGATQSLLGVYNPAYFKTGDIVHFPRTGENALVTAVDREHGVIETARGVGSKPWNLNKNEPVWILGGASQMSYEDEARQQADYEQYKREFLS